MENDQQTPYSRDEVKEEMKNLIDDISFTLCLRKNEPAVILMHLGWDWKRVTQCLAEKGDKFLAEFGLEPVVIDPNQDLSDSCCGICSKTAYDFNVFDDDDDDDSDDDSDDDDDAEEEEDDYDEGEGEGEYKDEGEGKGEGAVEKESDVEGEGDQGEGEVENVEDEGEGVSDGDVEYVEDEDDDHHFISTPFCSHKFCKSCWREYLENKFYSLKENLTIISCPNQDCGAAVGKQTIEKLGVYDLEMYENYVMKSYLEIKQFYVPNYNYVIDHI